LQINNMADGKIQSIEDSVKIEASKKDPSKIKTKLIAGMAAFIITIGGLSVFAKNHQSSEKNGQEIEQSSVTTADIVKPGEMKILPKDNLVTEFGGQVEIFSIHDGKKYPIPKLFGEQDYSNFDKVHTFFIQSTGGDVDNSNTIGVVNPGNEDINVRYADNVHTKRLMKEFEKKPEGVSDLIVIYDLNIKPESFLRVFSLNKTGGTVKLDMIGSAPKTK